MAATSVIQWLHLGIMVLVLVGASIAQAVLRLVYSVSHALGVQSLLDWLWTRSPSLRRLFAFRLGQDPSRSTAKTASFLLSARELVELAGFQLEEHAVTTADGYVLGVHRIVVSEGDSETDSDGDDGALNATAGSVAGSSTRAGRAVAADSACRSLRNRGRPPVLLQHGLMQCSESWLVGGRSRSLPFLLAAAGFDVWLGNNRGNKYSQKHVALAVEGDAFWDFSLDELARFDVPAVVDHVLQCTGAAKVAYVGFSQGTAQAFAALSLHPALNSKLSCFIALSPAVAIRGLARSPVTALVESNLNFFYLLFGRRRMLPVALDVQRMLSAAAWTDTIDASLTYLFAWRTTAIDAAFKRHAFHHLYSFTSVKSVLQWFQIIQQGRFAVMAEVPQSASLLSLLPGSASLPFLSTAAMDQHRVTPLYDPRKVAVPLALFAGGGDTLIDIPRLLEMLPAASTHVLMPGAAPASAAFSDALAERLARAQLLVSQAEAEAAGSAGAGLSLPGRASGDLSSAAASQQLGGSSGGNGVSGGGVSRAAADADAADSSNSRDGAFAAAASDSAIGSPSATQQLMQQQAALLLSPVEAVRRRRVEDRLRSRSALGARDAANGTHHDVVMRAGCAAAASAPATATSGGGRLLSVPESNASAGAGAANASGVSASSGGGGKGSGGGGGLFRHRASSSTLQALAAAMHDALGGYAGPADAPERLQPEAAAELLQQHQRHHTAQLQQQLMESSVSSAVHAPASPRGHVISAAATLQMPSRCQASSVERLQQQLLHQQQHLHQQQLYMERQRQHQYHVHAAPQPYMERQEVFVHVTPEWEHLDPMWATAAPLTVFPAVIDTLRRYAHTQAPQHPRLRRAWARAQTDAVGGGGSVAESLLSMGGAAASAAAAGTQIGAPTWTAGTGSGTGSGSRSRRGADAASTPAGGVAGAGAPMLDASMHDCGEEDARDDDCGFDDAAAAGAGGAAREFEFEFEEGEERRERESSAAEAARRHAARHARDSIHGGRCAGSTRQLRQRAHVGAAGPAFAAAAAQAHSYPSNDYAALSGGGDHDRVQAQQLQWQRQRITAAVPAAAEALPHTLPLPHTIPAPCAASPSLTPRRHGDGAPTAAAHAQHANDSSGTAGVHDAGASVGSPGRSVGSPGRSGASDRAGCAAASGVAASAFLEAMARAPSSLLQQLSDRPSSLLQQLSDQLQSMSTGVAHYAASHPWDRESAQAAAEAEEAPLAACRNDAQVAAAAAAAAPSAAAASTGDAACTPTADAAAEMARGAAASADASAPSMASIASDMRRLTRSLQQHARPPPAAATPASTAAVHASAPVRADVPAIAGSGAGGGPAQSSPSKPVPFLGRSATLGHPQPLALEVALPLLPAQALASAIPCGSDDSGGAASQQQAPFDGGSVDSVDSAISSSSSSGGRLRSGSTVSDMPVPVTGNGAHSDAAAVAAGGSAVAAAVVGARTLPSASALHRASAAAKAARGAGLVGQMPHASQAAAAAVAGTAAARIAAARALVASRDDDPQAEAEATAAGGPEQDGGPIRLPVDVAPAAAAAPAAGGQTLACARVHGTAAPTSRTAAAPGTVSVAAGPGLAAGTGASHLLPSASSAAQKTLRSMFLQSALGLPAGTAKQPLPLPASLRAPAAAAAGGVGSVAGAAAMGGGMGASGSPHKRLAAVSRGPA